MKTLLTSLLLALTFYVAPLRAEGPPLTVGIETFLPPFVMQGANKEVYGFDVDMMNALCTRIQRTCTFKIMRFDELLQAVSDRRLDAAVSAITITLDRAKIVSFTSPYMMSYSQFLQKTKPNTQAFSLELLNNKTIGIEAGSVYEDQILMMGVKNATIKKYGKLDQVLNALSEEEVDYVIMDTPTAVYWAANSSGAFMTIGDSYLYGNGLGIAVNSNDPNLLMLLNRALLDFQNSPDFETTYNRYFSHF